MDNELSAIADFVKSNRKGLASYIRQKLLEAEAKPYLDRLGREGIRALDREAAGVLLDLACALLRRLHTGRELQSEEILEQLPAAIRQSIRLPTSQERSEELDERARAALEWLDRGARG